MNIAVIIPAQDEAKTIKEVIDGIPRYCSVIVVDDGSKDNTGQIAEAAGAYVIRHNKGRGVGAAFKAGLDTAILLEPDIIVNIDGDGQMYPQDIPKLIQPILDGEADVTITTRFANKALMPKLPFLKKVGNGIFTKCVNILTGSNFTDTQCGFRAYSLEAAKRMNLVGEFTYTQESLLDLSEKGFVIKEVPLYVKGARKGKSRVVKNVFHYGLNASLIILRTIRDYKPLAFFGIISCFFMLTSFIFSGFIIQRKLDGLPFSEQNYIILLTIMIFFIAIGLGLLSLLADMNKRTKKNAEDILYWLKS